MDKGWGPFTTCKWTRVGGPATLHDLGAASKWTRVGADFPRRQGLGVKGWGPTLHDSAPNPAGLADGHGWGPQPFTTCEWTRGWGPPNPSRLANLKFLFGQALGPPNHRTLEHISQGTGSVSTDRNINDKPFVPECTLEQILNFA